MSKKLVEALKERKLISKKLEGVIEKIQKYSSITSVEKPAFDDEFEQKKQVQSLVQSGLDLLKRFDELKTSIDKTNLQTMFRIPKGIIMKEHEISLSEALTYKQKYKDYQNIFKSLNRNTADAKLRQILQNSDGTRAYSIQLFDEEFKNNWEKDLQMKLDYIDSHLEMLNATTDLIE